MPALRAGVHPGPHGWRAAELLLTQVHGSCGRGAETPAERRPRPPALPLRCGSDDPGRKPVCPSCRKDPRGTEQLQAKERRRTLALYGLSQEQWDRLIALQGNRCAVCKTTQPGGRGERWHIDHDHVTGQVRGLLCHLCNVGIGNLRDDPQIMMAAARYVAAHRSKAAVTTGPKDLEMGDVTAVLSHTSWPPGSG
jgi:Recombination endonuclease VII